jgi:hypothetical protein
MFTTCLAIILGLLIIYLIFMKNNNDIKREAMTQRVSSSPKAPVGQAPPMKYVPMPSTAPNTPSLEDNAFTMSGADITIYNTSGSKCKKCPYQGPPWRRRRYYSEFKEIYSPKARKLPGEDLRFDLLTPIPYSDAFVAPMGKSRSPPAISPTLAQITYPHQKTDYGTIFS